MMKDTDNSDTWFIRLKTSLFKFIPGPVYGVISVIVGALGYLISYLLYPPQLFYIGYYGSALGIGPGGIFFNLGLIISGILFYPFYLYLDDMLRREKVNEDLRKLTFVLVTISCIWFIFIGVFPGDPDNIFLFYAHGISALICYSSLSGYMIFLNQFFFKNPNFWTIHSYLGWIIAGMVGIFLFTWNPVLQWIFTIAYFIWLTYIPINLLVKKI